jgi:hypothetical protein
MDTRGHLFPSPDWIDAFARDLAAHPRARETATALDGVYRFVIEPAGPLEQRHTYDVEIRPATEGAAVERLPEPVETPRLSLAADYGRWRQLIEGRLDVAVAIMLRRLRVSGDLGGLKSNLGDTKPLLEALSQVDTRWRG